MPPILSTQITARIALWAFIFMVELLIAWIVKNWYVSTGHFPIYVGTAAVVFLASFCFGQSSVVLDFRELCLYDVGVHCLGWYLHHQGHGTQLYLALNYTVVTLKFIRILWPLRREHSHALADWPVFGVLGYWQAKKQGKPIWLGLANLSKQDGIAYLTILLCFPFIYWIRILGVKMPPEFWATIGILILLVGFRPFLAYVDQREVEHIHNERKAAALAATEEKNAAIQQLLAEREKDQALLKKYNDAMRDATHDLQHPMAVVRIHAHALLEKISPQDRPALQENMAALDQAMKEMSDMIDATVHSAQVVTGIIQPELRVVDMNALVKEFQAQWLDGSNRYGLDRFDVYPKRHAGLYCYCDLIILKRIVRNLLANAIEQSRPASGILLAIRQRQQHCIVQIWDKGPGIAEGVGQDGLANFAAFAQRLRNEGSHAKTTGKRSGHRLGMNNVLQLAMATGLQMHLFSKLGRGSVFAFALPLASAEQLNQAQLVEIEEENAWQETHAAMLAYADLPMPEGDFYPQKHHLEYHKLLTISPNGTSEAPGK